jgi:hypothetical protein
VLQSFWCGIDATVARHRFTLAVGRHRRAARLATRIIKRSKSMRPPPRHLAFQTNFLKYASGPDSSICNEYVVSGLYKCGLWVLIGIRRGPGAANGSQSPDFKHHSSEDGCRRHSFVSRSKSNAQDASRSYGWNPVRTRQKISAQLVRH